MITSKIFERVLHIGVNNEIGSAFVIDHNDENFIITAKHVIESIDFKNGEEIKINVYNNESWINLDCKVYVHNDEEIDIAVLKPLKKYFNLKKIDIGMEGLILGSDLYFLGFPYGMLMDSLPDAYGYPIPFIKKGIISGVLNKYDITSIYIDAHNNPGFSGGPVINILSGGKTQIIGVNVSYIKHENEVAFEDQDEDGQLYEDKLQYHENSGIMEVQGIKHVFEILSQNKF